MATWNGFTLGIHKPLKHCTFYYKIYKRNVPTEIPFLDLIIYIKESRLYTRLHTKATDRHIYLNFDSEHPVILKNAVPYSQFLRLKRIYTEPQHILEAQIQLYFFFILREYPQETILKAWKQTNKVSREKLLSPTETNHDTKHHFCLSLLTVEPTQTLRNFFSNIGTI